MTIIDITSRAVKRRSHDREETDKENTTSRVVKEEVQS
jgi:hypothetical protein